MGVTVIVDSCIMKTSLGQLHLSVTPVCHIFFSLLATLPPFENKNGAQGASQLFSEAEGETSVPWRRALTSAG